MYALPEDVFVPSDVSNALKRTEKLYNFSGKEMAWCRKKEHQYILLDMRRGFYKNEFNGPIVRFCMDNNENEVNIFLRRQVLTTEKERIRICRVASTGNVTMYDMGDYHAIHIEGNKVVLHRLRDSDSWESGPVQKHTSEVEARGLLRELFPDETYVVRYEPFCISWPRGDPSETDAKVSSYNVDFAVRRRGSTKVVGIEVKSDWGAWQWREAEARVNIHMYKEIMGAPCLLLVMSPTPTFYVNDQEISHEAARLLV
jgi:hypothetical protein